uniref:Uncharacterized protein n=1 Tax=Peronospora matthiolae TaxID=2874970 RepID=A0AAV1VK62_9STRA
MASSLQFKRFAAFVTAIPADCSYISIDDAIADPYSWQDDG